MSQVEVRERPTEEDVRRKRELKELLDGVRAHNQGVPERLGQRQAAIAEDATKEMAPMLMRELSGQAPRGSADRRLEEWARATGVPMEDGRLVEE